ncbi:hypothetical protein WICPIJ_007723 [Wickerhamomyces pijperi]|uniref:BSD domain-containing protein n=1 Tax=Wickerhamomyces pijperi TaxID=599730 RepID=A0A9P8TK60_WICPI|nr:hypothetical protein WICPIJ_007723 [Wickerhamomyces pijperi]
MSLVTGAATYKKKSGLLTIYEDRSPSILQWRPADSEVAIPPVEIILARITQMKATPATSEVMRLMVIVKDIKDDESEKSTPDGTAAAVEGAEEPEQPTINFVFTFGNRLVMDNIKESLQQIVARYKSAAQATQFVNDAKEKEKPLINTTFLDDALDTKRLLKNHELQQKLLLDDKKLMSNFTESVIKLKLPPLRFWATRVPQLRAFALANSQKRGPYNVLSSIKPTATSDNQVNVSVTREKIHTIFEQYPIVRRAYDENVPRISEGEFWSRFFSSKLFRVLRGEKVAVGVRGDFILDKYVGLDVDCLDDESQKKDDKANATTAEKEDEGRVGRILDLQANEEDDPVKKGNKPDITMQPNAMPETVQVLRSMNRLSNKMMNSLEHEYSRSATPETKNKAERELDMVRNEMKLKDLGEEEKVEYLKLDVKPGQEPINKEEDKQHKDVQNDQEHTSVDQSVLTPSKPQFIHSLQSMKRQLEPTGKELNLAAAKKQHIETTVKEISQLVAANVNQSQQSWNNTIVSGNVLSADPNTEEESPTDQLLIAKGIITKQQLESLRITHITSMEFLRQFWIHFQPYANLGKVSDSNNSKLTSLKGLVVSLKGCLDRIEAGLQNIKGENAEQSREAVRSWFERALTSIKWALGRYEDVFGSVAG